MNKKYNASYAGYRGDYNQNYYGGSGGYYDGHKKSTQQMVSKEKIAQIQDAELSNDTMCRVLTLGEKYALGQNYKYGAYNMSSATGEDLLRLFVREIEIFRLSYQDYVEEHGDYMFPKNLSKSQILEDIKNWISNIPDDSQQYFFALMDVINGNYKFSLKEEIKKLKAKKKNSYVKEGEKAKNLMSHVPNISYNSKKLAKKAEDAYMNDHNYRPEVDLSNKRNQHFYNELSKDTHYIPDDEDDLK